jgi:Predicted metal-dependent membrane protease
MAYGILLGIRIGMKYSQEGKKIPGNIASQLMNAISQNMIYLFGEIGVIVCGIVFFFWYRSEIKGEIRGSLKNVVAGKNVILLFGLGVGSQFFISGLLNLLQRYLGNLFTDYTKQMGQLTDGNIVAVILLLVLIAPITEELVFRGMILHHANRYVSFLSANILQAVLFGIYHLNVIQGLYAAMMGFLLGYVYYKFKTIFASMLLHMIINTSSLVVVLFPDNSISYFLFVLGGGIAVLLTLVILKPTKTLVPIEANWINPEYWTDTNNIDKEIYPD